MQLSTLLTIGSMAIATNSFAQIGLQQLNSTANTVNAAAYSANNVNSAVGNTTNAVKGTVNTVQQLGSLFKKKEKVPETAKETAVNGIVITISGIDYTKLKTLEEAIKPINGVKATVKKFSANGSTIEVNYTGKDDQLWDALPESIKSTLILTDLGNGKITLEEKK